MTVARERIKEDASLLLGMKLCIERVCCVSTAVVIMAVSTVMMVASAGARRDTSGQCGVRRVFLHADGDANIVAPRPPQEVPIFSLARISTLVVAAVWLGEVVVRGEQRSSALPVKRSRVLCGLFGCCRRRGRALWCSGLSMHALVSLCACFCFGVGVVRLD